MPVYNAEPFLAEALDSVIAQDYQPVEVLVVNDGSTDGSADIVRAYPGIRYMEQDNRGAGAARNLAIANANGDYVAFVDADDVVPPNKLSLQVSHLERHPELAWVMGHQHWIEEPPGAARDAVYGELEGIPLLSLVIRSAVLQEIGEFINPPSEDMDMMVRLRAAGHQVAVLPEVVLHRRYHGQNQFLGQGLGPIRLSSLKDKLDAERARREAK